MQIRSFGISHPGMIREENEDNFLDDEEEKIFLVADGMGGLARGEMASRIAAETIRDFIKRSRCGDAPWPITPQNRFSEEENRFLAAAAAANQAIYHEFLRDVDQRSMGTTLTGLLVDDQRVIIAHIGDSRVYRLRNETLELLTEDHSFVMEEVRQGNLTLEQAMKHPHKHVLSRALGTFECAQVDISSHEAQDGDLYLLCSDGLYDMVSDREMLSVIQSNIEKPLSELGERLVSAANQQGGRDNITVVLVRLDE